MQKVPFTPDTDPRFKGLVSTIGPWPIKASLADRTEPSNVQACPGSYPCFLLLAGQPGGGPGGETKAGAQEAGPVAHYCPAGHGFWTKEFILIELIALELDWFQLYNTHTSDHLPVVWGKKCSRGGIYSQRKTGRGGLGGCWCE